MQEIIEAIFPPFVTNNLYPEYMAAIVIVVEFIRFLTPGVDKKIAPKFLTAVIGILLGAVGYFTEVEVQVDLTLFIKKMLFTYAITVMFYQLIVKPVKDRFFPKVVEKQKE